MKKLRSTLLILALATLAAASASAQATELTYDHRVAGDRSLTVQLGMEHPLGIQPMSFGAAVADPNLADGVTMGVDLDFYLTDAFRLGGGLKGMGMQGINGNNLFMVPITFRASYELKAHPFSFPLGMAAGFCFTNYKTQTSFNPVLAPSAGAFYNLNSAWSFGATVTEWTIFEPIFAGGKISSSEGRIAYLADLNAAFIYHF